MAAVRKTQQEIERTLKKVNEGIDEFKDTWEQMDDATDVSPKVPLFL